MRLIFRKYDVADIGQNNPLARTRKGDLIDILETGRYAGKQVEPTSPDYEDIYIIMNVPDLNMTRSEAISTYCKLWKHEIEWEIVDQNDEGWRLRIFDNSGSATAYISKTSIENFVGNWNCEIQAFAENSVTLDIPVFGIATSKAFWRRDISAVVWERLTFNSDGTRIRATLPGAWTNTAEKQQKIQDMIEAQDGVIVNVNIPNSQITFDIARATAGDEFKEQVRDTFENIILRKRRFRIDDSEIDSIVSNGNEVTITKAQLLAKLKDKVLD
jgi:hypothetical protein